MRRSVLSHYTLSNSPHLHSSCSRRHVNVSTTMCSSRSSLCWTSPTIHTSMYMYMCVHAYLVTSLPIDMSVDRFPFVPLHLASLHSGPTGHCIPRHKTQSYQTTSSSSLSSSNDGDLFMTEIDPISSLTGGDGMCRSFPPVCDKLWRLVASSSKTNVTVCDVLRSSCRGWLRDERAEFGSFL